MAEWERILKKTSELKLYIIHTGFVHMNGNLHLNKKDPKSRSLPADNRLNPVFAYLVEHPVEGYLLLDTGLHSSFSQSRFGNFGYLVGSLVKTKTETGMDVISQIESIDIDPVKIKKIVMSHLHFDHSSGLSYFKDHNDLTVFLDQEEISSSRTPLGLFKGYIRKHYEGMRLEPIIYSRGIPPFFQSCDVYNDHSVYVVRTPGHTPGHISVLLNMSGGPIFLTFDAAHRKVNIDEAIPPKGEYDKATASIESIKAFLRMVPETVVVYGHDPDQIAGLKLLPDYYT